MDPIIEFLSDGVLPSEVKEAEKIQRISVWFWLAKIGDCTDGHLVDRTYYIFILKRWTAF